MKSKKSNTPVVVTACLAILAVVVAVGFVVFSSGGNDGNGSGDDGGNPPFTEASPYTPTSTPYESDSYKPLSSLLPDVKDYMPTGFYNRLTSCDTKAKKPFSLSDAFESMDTEMYSCLPESSSVKDHSSESMYTGFKYIQTGDDGQKVYDHAQSSTLKGKTLQQAGNGWPEIIYYSGGKYSIPDALAWYPEKKAAIVIHGQLDQTEDQTKEMLKFFNLMPQG